MIKLADRIVDLLDEYGFNCVKCHEPFGTTDELDVKGDWDCVVGKNGLVYHSGCCIEAGEE